MQDTAWIWNFTILIIPCVQRLWLIQVGLVCVIECMEQKVPSKCLICEGAAGLALLVQGEERNFPKPNVVNKHSNNAARKVVQDVFEA